MPQFRKPAGTIRRLFQISNPSGSSASQAERPAWPRARQSREGYALKTQAVSGCIPVYCRSDFDRQPPSPALNVAIHAPNRAFSTRTIVPGLAAAHAAKSGRGTAGFPPVSTIQKEPASPFPVPLRPTNNKTAFSKRYRRVVIQIWLRRTWIGKKKSSATVKPCRSNLLLDYHQEIEVDALRGTQFYRK
jgi:hypothetical protein